MYLLRGQKSGSLLSLGLFEIAWPSVCLIVLSHSSAPSERLPWSSFTLLSKHLTETGKCSGFPKLSNASESTGEHFRIIVNS